MPLPVEIVVEARWSGLRLDRVLALACPEHSRSYLQKLIRADGVLLNDATASPRQEVKTGDRLSVRFLKAPDSRPAAEPMDFPVLYEDDHVLAVDKPAGLVVHPGAGTPDGTLVNALLAYRPEAFGAMLEPDGVPRPGIVHRIDKDTSGALVIAKNPQARARLSAAFKDRETAKEYLAVVSGQPAPSAGTIDAPIHRHSTHRYRMAVDPAGRSAVSHYRTLAVGPEAALLAVRIETGRTHQIRVHLSHLGHPILGDSTYGKSVAHLAPRQLLHAWHLTVPHPVTGAPLALTAPPPADLLATLVTQGIDWPDAER